ncbi:MAG TPA: hypothetical protein VK133_02160 [Amoebophilaceae bacterium]|nr:hypothetical protein [Amoebophilaceae bacterium]
MRQKTEPTAGASSGSLGTLLDHIGTLISVRSKAKRTTTTTTESDTTSSATSSSNNDDVESGDPKTIAPHSESIPLQEINLNSDSESKSKSKTKRVLKSKKNFTGRSATSSSESSGLRKSLSTSNIPQIVVHCADDARGDDSIFPL